MKTLFEIGSVTAAGKEHTLLFEVGKDYCSHAYLHKPTHKIDYLQLSTFDEFTLDENVAGMIQNLKTTAVESVVVCSAFPQALLFPHKYFSNDFSALDLVYEQPAQEYFKDRIAEWQIVNMYSLPQAICLPFQQNFSTVQYVHAYTPTIKIYNGYVADNQLMVHFTEQYFRVLLKKDMAIHLAQTYFYKTPLDVIYYLLKICYEFELSQQEVFLILSGHVEKESNLFSDLQQYFTHIHFAQQPEISLPQSSYPHYFFTSIYNLAACVL